jgi:hypothetical protein
MGEGKLLRTLATIVAGLSLVVAASCKSGGPGKSTGPDSGVSPGGGKGPAIGLGPAFSANDLTTRFGRYYRAPTVSIDAKVPAYSLPLAEDGIQNFAEMSGKLPIDGPARSKLLANGFVSVDYNRIDDVAEFYQKLKDQEVPVFVTTDSVLHLYHIQFDETLRVIEEKEFYPDLVKFSRAFQQEMQKRYDGAGGREKAAYQKGLAFFSVALKLLDPQAEVPPAVKDLVNQELTLIEAHAEFKESPIFIYKEDYTQYVPRGHYTRSEELKRYFKAMMWYGRMTMLIKGAKDFGPDAHQPALVSEDEAQAQTILGCAIAGMLGDLKVDQRTAAQVWERMYVVTAYYVGLADDLTPLDYRTALGKVFGNTFEPGTLVDPDAFLKLKAELVKLRKPAIYSGTGESGVNLDLEPGRQPTREQLDRILGKTQGFRVMGQRYVPDSYMLGQLVTPAVGGGGNNGAFTTVMIEDYGPVRAFPRGLDVMAVLGSDRAREIVRELGDDGAANYESQMKKLRDEFGAISAAEWNRNLYWSWLYCLAGLVKPVSGPGWPTFMTTTAWQDKELSAALGSWSSLRHDTILYAKQSYTPTVTAESARPEPAPPKPVVGYVEPAPEFYARLIALTRMSIDGLGEMKVLDNESMGRLKALGEILTRLQAISEKELRNEELSEDDYEFIRNFGDRLSAVVAGASEKGQKTVLIADVHTDQNSKKVLEEGTGYLRLLVVAYKLPQGHVLIGAGPALSYYEFKHPMDDRLTDEKWRTLLDGGTATPPEWTKSFAEFK